MRLVSDPDTTAVYEKAYRECNIRYGDMKKQLAEDMIKFITPIRERSLALLADEKGLREVMEKGAEKARKSARATIEVVRQAMGLNYF